jgi:hypothetical protein
MKYLILIVLVFVCIAAPVCAQQPIVRRGLDQIDLLSMPRTTTPAGSPVNVDLETFQLLEPLVRYCRELEREYKTSVLESNVQLTAESFAGVFTRKSEAIQRSLFLIRKIKEPSPQVSALLNETDAFGRDLAMIAVSLYDDDQAGVGDDIARLGRKYGAGDQPDKKQLVGAILRRLNANFGRLKLEQ